MKPYGRSGFVSGVVTLGKLTAIYMTRIITNLKCGGKAMTIV